MKPKWYRSGWLKGGLILTTFLCGFYFLFSAYQVSRFPNLILDVFQRKVEKEYQNSTSFETDLEEKSLAILGGIEGTSLLEKGKNPEEELDIGEYLYGKKNGLVYSLQDLLEWSENFQDERAKEVEAQIVVSTKVDGSYAYIPYGEFITKVYQKEWKLDFSEEEREKESYTHQEISQILENGDSFQVVDGNQQLLFTSVWKYDGTYLEEKYAPKGYSSLFALANESKVWNGRLSETYELLEESLKELEEDLFLGKKLNRDWKEGNTNLTYLLLDTKEKKVYTNRKDFSDFEKRDSSLDLLKKEKKYLVVSENLKDFQTNLNYARAESWVQMLRHSPENEGGEIFAVGVDTQYPISDEFYQNHQDYQRHFHYAWKFMISSVLFFVTGITALIWLTVIAGRRAKDEELHLSWFDRIPVEIQVFGIWGTLGGFGLALLGEMANGLSDTVGFSMVTMGLTWFLMISWVVYLSLVRKFKGKILWKGSLLQRFLDLIRRLLHHIDQVWKQIIWVGVLILLHAFLLAAGRSFFFLIFVVTLDVLTILFFLKKEMGVLTIRKGIQEISKGNLGYKIPLEGLSKEQTQMAESINSMGSEFEKMLENQMKNEKMKTELIANVSHDIKTPLTSIINYVGLLKQEEFSNPNIQKYIEVIENKSQRLKTLTEDVVEASRVNSGAIALEKMNLNLAELLQQVSGEFEERFQGKGLEEILSLPEKEVIAYVDGRRMWRVFENLYGNVEKYSLESSRVYTELKKEGDKVCFSIKNISKQPLNMEASELTERFIRGDLARSTEGSGLGLSIAKSIVELHGGRLEVVVDGDLFKIQIEL